RHVKPAGLSFVTTHYRIVRSCNSRILQAEVQPVAAHGLELRAEARPDEVAQQPPFFIVMRGGIIGRSIRHAAWHQTPAVVGHPLHDLSTSRITTPDVSAVGTARGGIIVEVVTI